MICRAEYGETEIIQTTNSEEYSRCFFAPKLYILTKNRLRFLSIYAKLISKKVGKSAFFEIGGANARNKERSVSQ